MENTQLWMNGLNQQKRPITQQPVPVQFALSREEQLEAKRLAEEANFSFEGYQVVRREFISHRFDPAMTIRGNSITFNNSCISKLENASYIQFLINPTEQKMIIRPCDEGARDAIRWCILKADKRKSRQINKTRQSTHQFDLTFDTLPLSRIKDISMLYYKHQLKEVITTMNNSIILDKVLSVIDEIILLDHDVDHNDIVKKIHNRSAHTEHKKSSRCYGLHLRLQY